MSPAPKILSPSQVERYRQDGFAFPVPVLDAAEVRALRADLEHWERQQGHPLDFPEKSKSYLLYRWADALVHHPKVLDAVEDVIGPDILVYHTTLFLKEANQPAFVRWHQDGVYFFLEPRMHVTAWVALSEASIEAGCMQAVPGSHKLGQMRHADMQDTNNLLSRGQTLTAEVDRSRTAYMAVKAGQFSLHHTHLVHNSRPNRSKNRRVGLGISYIPTHARCTMPTRVSAMLVRGTDTFGNFDDERRPLVEAGPEERAFHAEAVATFRKMNAEIAGASK